MQTGGGISPQASQPIVNAEAKTNRAESFEQLKRAQQVPSPMGVLPSSNANTQSSPEESIMDSMVNSYNKRNPW
jgi:hypothetical protein